MSRRPQPLPALLVLAAAACVAPVAASPPRLREVCSRLEDDISCSCDQRHPNIDVVSSDTAFLSGARVITIANCSLVKMAAHTLEKTSGLQSLSVRNVSRLELESPLPKSVRELVLAGIGQVASLPVAVFQAISTMERLIIQDVAFKELDSHFLDGVTLEVTEITGCRFPNLSSDSLYIESQKVTVSGNSFANLSTEALRIQAQDATMADNSFGFLANGSIQWQHWSSGVSSKLLFQKNTIQSSEKGALSGLRSSENSTYISDNVLLCLGGGLKRCNESLSLPDVLTVCDAEDVCPYRQRTGLTETLAKARGCSADGLLSEEDCAVLLVGNQPSGAASLRSASSVAAAAVALLVAITRIAV